MECTEITNDLRTITSVQNNLAKINYLNKNIQQEFNETYYIVSNQKYKLNLLHKCEIEMIDGKMRHR